MTFVASTHDQATMLRAPVPLLPGRHLFENYRQVLVEGFGRGFSGVPIWVTLMNSMIMALASRWERSRSRSSRPSPSSISAFHSA